ncbi:hypothetical protein OG21DRAFT_1445479 [Imleria badia]|nr:hypothetical protein OG21DRAFT_1445479 [Imleria badia]
MSTTSSSDSYLSSYTQIATSSLSMSPAEATPPTLFHAAFSPPAPYFCPPSTYQSTSPPSSGTPSTVTAQLHRAATHKLSVPKPARPTLLAKALQEQPNQNLPSPSSSSTLSSCEPSAEPASLRPHCAAKDRLISWHLVCARSLQHPLQHEDTQRLLSILPHAWADSTKETYGSGLLAFHTFCDFKSIPEPERAPVAADVMSTFISHLAGAYAASTVVNYVSAVQAWHTIHGLSWNINKREADLLYKAAHNLAPPTSKRPAREPYTVATIAAIQERLDLALPLHAAVFACLTTTFFAAAHTGEFTLPTLKAFEPARHITHASVSTQFDRNGLQMTCFRLPWTKKAPIGEEVNWAKQNGPHDPEEALENHFRVNNPPDSVPLRVFTYRAHSAFVPLT